MKSIKLRECIDLMTGRNVDFRDTNVPPAQIKWLRGVLDSAPGPVVGRGKASTLKEHG